MKRLQVTLAILKPDLCMRQKTKEAVMMLIRQHNFFIIRQNVMQFTPNKAQEFYAEHRGRFFYNRLVDFMCIHPCQCLILAHANAIHHWRELMGPTKPYIAHFTAPHTIRGTYGLTDTRNSTHGSDSDESAEREIAVLFPDFDLREWYEREERYFRSGKVTFCEEEQVHKLEVEL